MNVPVAGFIGPIAPADRSGSNVTDGFALHSGRYYVLRTIVRTIPGTLTLPSLSQGYDQGPDRLQTPPSPDGGTDRSLPDRA